MYLHWAKGKAKAMSLLDIEFKVLMISCGSKKSKIIAGFDFVFAKCSENIEACHWLTKFLFSSLAEHLFADVDRIRSIGYVNCLQIYYDSDRHVSKHQSL